MQNTDLLIRLRDLHEELSGINIDLKSPDQVDDETIEVLGQLATDIGGLIDRTNDQANFEAADPSEQGELLERVTSFETNHPRVTSFLNQMSDLLAMLGI
ncbi:MAG: DUF4404 family protein [Mariniblastus sp.]|nr:DUF4404 family protein [Mariniblastus sp.]